jgi:hypothetical protein
MMRFVCALERTRLAGALVFAALLAGCGGEGDPGSPVEVRGDAGPPPVDAGGDAPALPEAGPVKRTISMRNPFGGPVDNLLADGDFELSTVIDGDFPQSGWRGFTDGGSTQATVKMETGGLCRTGLRCAVLEKDLILFGRGTAAPDEKAHVASIWAKVPAGASCNVIKFLLVGCDTFGSLKKLSSEPEPNEDGWCEYGGVLPKRDSAVCFYGEAEVEEGATAIVDSAVLIAEDTAASTKSLEVWVPSPGISARVAAVQEQVRKSMPLAPRRVPSPATLSP